jgi:hypothetical protein
MHIEFCILFKYFRLVTSLREGVFVAFTFSLDRERNRGEAVQRLLSPGSSSFASHIISKMHSFRFVFKGKRLHV